MLNFELSSQPYQFECPSETDWLPCEFALFEENRESDYVPSQQRIAIMIEAIKSKWSPQERHLRRLRAKTACELGVCRNH